MSDSPVQANPEAAKPRKHVYKPIRAEAWLALIGTTFFVALFIADFDPTDHWHIALAVPGLAYYIGFSIWIWRKTRKRKDA